MNDTLLDVRNLSTWFYTDEGIVYALDDVSFSMRRGETLGIVGESGSGKSVTALTIMGLIPSPPGKIKTGEIIFEGQDLLKLTPNAMRRIRGDKIAMIFQEPMTSLNPVFTIGSQVTEAITLHQKVSAKQAHEMAVEALRAVEIPSAEKRMEEYPHQMSGGMRQRVMIAMALCGNPQLLICDEPTTALDVTIQAQILELINSVQKRFNTSVILITHDLGVVAQVTENVLVMYAGKVMEYGSVKDVFTSPCHPYTEALLKSIPSIDNDTKRLPVIPGMVPSLSNRPSGCFFHPRCQYAVEECSQKMPELLNLPGGRKVRCLRYRNVGQPEVKEGGR